MKKIILTFLLLTMSNLCFSQKMSIEIEGNIDHSDWGNKKEFKIEMVASSNTGKISFVEFWRDILKKKTEKLIKEKIEIDEGFNGVIFSKSLSLPESIGRYKLKESDRITLNITELDFEIINPICFLGAPGAACNINDDDHYSNFFTVKELQDKGVLSLPIKLLVGDENDTFTATIRLVE